MKLRTFGGREVIMANKVLFQSTPGRTVPKTDTVNAAGGKAYTLSSKAALARYGVTGCISNTYYVKAQDHLKHVIQLANECDPEFIAKLAVYARKEGHMKDMPALLMSILASRGNEGRPALKAAFPIVIDNGRMLRNFVQIMRSGQVGRKSLGTGPRNLVRGFFEQTPNWLFRQLGVGQTPSGEDIIKMIHPKGSTPEHDALFGYMIGKIKPGSEKWDQVPPIVKQFEEWKADRSQAPPAVPFELLTAQKLTADQWARIIRQGQWHFIRMNLNTAIRQGALKADPGLEEFIANRLRDKEIIHKARVMPYQLLAAYKHVSSDIPRSIVDALHDAVEIAVDNVPATKGRMLIVVDVSGSMSSPITGWDRNSPKASKVSCVDVAALFSAAILRKNREAAVLPVDTQVHLKYRPEPRDSVLSNAGRLAKFGGGGTALSKAFQHANSVRLKVDHIVVISDQESWADSYPYAYDRGSPLIVEWELLRNRNPNAKLVCIDITPGKTHHIPEGYPEILHIAGWSDIVFRVIDSFLSGNAKSWIEMIEKIDLVKTN